MSEARETLTADPRPGEIWQSNRLGDAMVKVGKCCSCRGLLTTLPPLGIWPPYCPNCGIRWSSIDYLTGDDLAALEREETSPTIGKES